MRAFVNTPHRDDAGLPTLEECNVFVCPFQSGFCHFAGRKGFGGWFVISPPHIPGVRGRVQAFKSFEMLERAVYKYHVALGTVVKVAAM